MEVWAYRILNPYDLRNRIADISTSILNRIGSRHRQRARTRLFLNCGRQDNRIR